jgi:G3E family GTPase
MTRSQPLPLLVLTGFLGSGKTTVLGHWLKLTDVPLKRTAVIINDFGSVNVDAALLARRQLELRSITGGCVCCQSVEEMVGQVKALADNTELDLAWIETSGLADPEEVLDHLSSPELQGSTVIRRLIHVVDASDFPCSWRGRAVQEEQIRYADLILLNKADRVDEAARLRVEIALRQINPKARVVSTRQGQIEPALLSESGLSRNILAREEASSEEGDAAHHNGDHEGHHEHTAACDHGHAHAHNHDSAHAASTLFIPLEAPVERGAFHRFLVSLPSSIFRAKGFVRFVEEPEKLHTFQQVRDQAELLVLPLEDAAGMHGGLVLIGPQLNEKQIRALAGGLITSPAP